MGKPVGAPGCSPLPRQARAQVLSRQVTVVQRRRSVAVQVTTQFIQSSPIVILSQMHWSAALELLRASTKPCIQIRPNTVAP